MAKAAPHGSTTLVDNEFVSLWFYPLPRILHHKIYKFLPALAFQELLNTGARHLQKYKATKWLGDNRENPVVSKENHEWARAVWTPRALDAGFKYWATVMPTQAIGRLQLRMFIQEYEDLGVTVQAFDEVDEAFRWLQTVDM